MRALSAIADAPQGGRNVALLRRATLMGGYLAAGAIGEAEVERELVAAGTAAGLPRHEVVATIKSGIRRGLQRPIEWEARR
ncbi:hypothetical protein [Roseicella frigidaeris]|uniref:Uncharacterized protein n=1 Tax=Roseicella frigidaeris TaxID=2230885 RepID=A0A327M0M6_9PROT|nr:hypothetical protein [Roseicella frigidaeris]RAI55914.1 hypothetical protein DOO78_23485 [Roseicella frigidaeris]